MTMGEQTRWWVVVLIAIGVFLWVFSGAVTPFIAGMAIAYFLDPVADRLERLGASRLLATAVVAAGALAATALALLLLVPALINQIAALAQAAPDYLRAAQEFLGRIIADRVPDAFEADGPLRRAFDEFSGRMQQVSIALVEGLFSGGLALIDFLSLAVITPVVAFYMLLDWDRMVDEIDHWLPRRHAPVIRRLAGEVDAVLAGFVRGQFSVCLILGAFYALALVLIGLNFGLVVGIFAGLVSFIPFVGSLTGGALSIGIALFQFWGDWMMIALVAAVFLIGQAVEGNFLTPKLVGGSVGLHPVWLMFALACFGAALGFAGLLIAVPAAAAIGVLVRFGLEQYKAGRLYQGGEALVPDDPDHERDR